MKMLDPTRDGIDHINVYLKGRTLLGRMLSNLYWAPCVIGGDGDFNTVEGYWYWLSCGDERLRSLKGFDCKKLGRSLRAPDWRKDPEFKEKICYAIYCKVTQHQEILLPLLLTSLPFVHYYVYGHQIIAPGDGEWVLDYILHLRSTLKGREEVDDAAIR